MHESNCAAVIAISQADVLGKTFGATTADADYIAVLNVRFDSRNPIPGYVIDGTGCYGVLDLADFRH